MSIGARVASPCSVPDWLRLALPLETPEQQACCREHDADYLAGGDRRARFLRDLRFARRLVVHGQMDPDTAEQYFWGVRQYGGGHWCGGDAPGAPPLRPPSEQEAP